MTRSLIIALVPALLLALPGVALAQAQNFPVRIIPIQSAPPADPSENHCLVKVWVDDVATIYFRNEVVGITTQSGRPARDMGTQCSGPVPDGPVQNFRIVSSAQPRTYFTNVITPARSNDFTGAISLSDPTPGGRTYEFEVAWRDPRADFNRRNARETNLYRRGDVVAANTPRPRDEYREERRDGYQEDSRRDDMDEEAACQRSVLDQMRSRNRDDDINVEFRSQVRREDAQGPRVKIRGNGWATGRNDSARFTYECVVNERSNNVVTSAYTVRGNTYR